MFTPNSEMNPRHLREKFLPWVGKKVTVGLTTFHYICGKWSDIDGYDAVFSIGGRELRVNMNEIDNVAESPEFQAEYFK